MKNGKPKMQPFVTVTLDPSKASKDNPNGIVVLSNINPPNPGAILQMLGDGVAAMGALIAERMPAPPVSQAGLVLANGEPAPIDPQEIKDAPNPG